MHFTWFDDALYNLTEDPGERRNLIDDPGARGQADRMRARLEALVDPEEVTRRAFEVQKRFLDRFVADRTEDELTAPFSRMGPAYARVMAVKCKTGSLGMTLQILQTIDPIQHLIRHLGRDSSEGAISLPSYWRNAAQLPRR